MKFPFRYTFLHSMYYSALCKNKSNMCIFFKISSRQEKSKVRPGFVAPYLQYFLQVALQLIDLYPHSFPQSSKSISKIQDKAGKEGGYFRVGHGKYTSKKEFIKKTTIIKRILYHVPLIAEQHYRRRVTESPSQQATRYDKKASILAEIRRKERQTGLT